MIRVDAKADAYGGRGTAVGTVTIGQPFALQLTVRLPLGIVNHEQVVLTPIDDSRTRVTFN